VVQEALLQAWQGLPFFRGDARFSTWVTRIVINRCHNLRRGARPVEPLWGDDGAPTVPPADTVVIASQRWQAAQAAVLDLPFDQRAALVLNTFAGYTHAETGRILGITESAPRSGCTGLARRSWRECRTGGNARANPTGHRVPPAVRNARRRAAEPGR
jgi:RNA polymerase sigma-70 factor, ECF subfamily